MMKAPCISLDMQGAAYVQGINPTASLWGMVKTKEFSAL
jgi:hypothetical protein